MKAVLFVVLGLILLTGCDKVEKALSCPVGQHSEFAYFMPIYHSNGDGSGWVQQYPVYECRSDNE